ncbi:hypothetical protein QR680_012721 [Steinernema hermaphroditum]|uniref:Uncharacterized protein n=1 Tax=Steinernema hermaphroditum TaxID=289476 RepID=A0AA39I4K3_9BILA|nr:hypothetical protein QR680_012721 [Steinernema hermaphroditum]
MRNPLDEEVGALDADGADGDMVLVALRPDRPLPRGAADLGVEEAHQCAGEACLEPSLEATEFSTSCKDSGSFLPSTSPPPPREKAEGRRAHLAPSLLCSPNGSLSTSPLVDFRAHSYPTR